MSGESTIEVKIINGHVAFIDILGFSSIVSDSKFPDTFRPYAQAVEDALHGQSGRLGYLVFSDSIILYDVISKNEPRPILRSCSYLFENLLTIGLPFRGCISCGDFSVCRTTQGTVVAGTPIVDAYHYEKKQDWIGIILSPTMVKRHWAPGTPAPGFRSEDAHVRAYKYIPLKSNQVGNPEPFDGYAIVPWISEGKEFIFEECIQRLSRLSMMAPDTSAQAKYHKTIKFLKEIAHSVSHERARSASGELNRCEGEAVP